MQCCHSVQILTGPCVQAELLASFMSNVAHIMSGEAHVLTWSFDAHATMDSYVLNILNHVLFAHVCSVEASSKR